MVKKYAPTFFGGCKVRYVIRLGAIVGGLARKSQKKVNNGADHAVYYIVGNGLDWHAPRGAKETK